jgi:hypothetical protein
MVFSPLGGSVSILIFTAKGKNGPRIFFKERLTALTPRGRQTTGGYLPLLAS